MELLDFEKAVAPMNAEIAALRAGPQGPDISRAIKAAETKRTKLLKQIYADLTPWQKTKVARHPDRPRLLAIAAALFTEWEQLAGDRKFGDDPAIIGGPARFNGRPVMLIGQEKGHDTQSRVARNFGMAKPEGYRKAARLMEMADRFGLPIVTLVDTSGAFPGIEAEERGQAEAIARSTEACLNVKVPLVSTIIGEGGSGGAVALAVANHLMMLEHSIYGVISPEGCASILWRDSAKASEAATAMRVSAQDLLALGVIDEVIAEPVGGAHRAPAQAIAALGERIAAALQAMEGRDCTQLRDERRAKYLAFARVGGGAQ